MDLELILVLSMATILCIVIAIDQRIKSKHERSEKNGADASMTNNAYNYNDTKTLEMPRLYVD